MAELVEAPPVDVQVATLERVEAVLRAAQGPVSRNHILARLKEQGRGTTSARLNRALGYLFDHAMAVEGSKGIQWTYSQSASLGRARATGRRL
ncbi:MAG: hypothetical protein ACPGQL_01035 [Thermoplasmatota archaeon]